MHRAFHFLSRKEGLLLMLLVLVGGAILWVGYTYAATASNSVLNADGYYQKWIPKDSPSSTVHYSSVDETKCNGIQDYNYSTTIGDRDSYAVNLSSIPNGYRITAIEIIPCASLHTKGYGSPKLSVFYRFNGADSVDKGSYSLSGTTPRNLPSTKFNSLLLEKNSESQLEIGTVLTGFGTTGVRVSRLAARLTFAAPPPPTLNVKIDTNYPQLLNDHYIIAGTQKYFVGRAELKAQGGDVKLKDLVLNLSSKNPRSDIENTFDTLNIYEDPAMTKLLSSKQVTPGIISLQNINYTVPRDTVQYLYLGLNINSIGTGDNGTAVSNVTVALGLKKNGTTAKSVTTNVDLSRRDVNVVENYYTKAMTVLAAQIVNVSNNFTGGELVDGEQTFFSFGVTAQAGVNTDQSGVSLPVYLSRLKLQLASDVTNASSTKLCHVSTGSCIDLRQVIPINGNNDITMLQTANDGYVDMTDFANNDARRIKSGETVQYEVRGIFSGITDKYVQGSIQDVNNSGIVWGYDVEGNGSLDFMFTDLRKLHPRPSGYPDIYGGVLN